MHHWGDHQAQKSGLLFQHTMFCFITQRDFEELKEAIIYKAKTNVSHFNIHFFFLLKSSKSPSVIM